MLWSASCAVRGSFGEEASHAVAMTTGLVPAPQHAGIDLVRSKVVALKRSPRPALRALLKLAASPTPGRPHRRLLGATAPAPRNHRGAIVLAVIKQSRHVRLWSTSTEA
jgi:hypothetical protein